jgi:hypothetical protein
MRALSKDTSLASTRIVVPRTEKTWIENQLKNHARDRQVVCRRSSGVKTSLTPVAWWAASSRSCSAARQAGREDHDDDRQDRGDDEGPAPADERQGQRRQAGGDERADRPAALDE